MTFKLGFVASKKSKGKSSSSSISRRPDDEGVSKTVIMKKVENGLISGNLMCDGLTKSTTSAIFPDKISKVTGKVGPYLGSLGGTLGIVSAFWPGSESPELKEMKRRFSEVDDKFDQVFNQFAETQKLIVKIGINSQFSEYELEIKNMARLMRSYLNAEGTHGKAYAKQRFLDEYKPGAANKIWIGMMTTASLTSNIPKAAMTFTNYNRLEVQNIMLRITSLLLLGEQVEGTYHTFTYGEDSKAYVNLTEMWQRKTDALTKHLISIDAEVKNNWEKAANTDVRGKVQEWGDKDNAKLADALYHFLSTKYEWKDWHVLVFNSKLKDDEYVVKPCSGSFFMKGKKQKNILVSGVDKDKNRNSESAYRFKFHTSSSCITGSCYDSYEKEIEKCNFVDFGRIKKKNSDIANSGPRGRLQMREVKDWQLFAFS